MLGEQHKRGGYVEQMEGNQVHTYLSQVCLGLEMVERTNLSISGPRRRGQGGHQHPPPGFPDLSAIYIAEIYVAMENQVEKRRGTSFVDDATWAAEGDGFNEAAQRRGVQPPA